jgi:small subunit ribosomal protein S24e
MEILQNKKNNLLHREEVVISLESKSTPSKNEVIKEVSEKMKKPAENIVIEKIDGKYGERKVKIYAKIYDELKFRDKFETIPRKIKKKIAEEAKKAAEAAKVAVPAEGA